MSSLFAHAEAAARKAAAAAAPPVPDLSGLTLTNCKRVEFYMALLPEERVKATPDPTTWPAGITARMQRETARYFAAEPEKRAICCMTTALSDYAGTTCCVLVLHIENHKPV